jgi:exopolysaccharide biosynthesis polyprenyl glycosylphosphotransferase
VGSNVGFRSRAKRLVDTLVASIGLVVSAPLMLLVGLAVRLGSPGPALYRQRRVGQHSTGFDMLKFRTMVESAEPAGEAVWADAKDARVTPVGRVLRLTRLDELPQLWNVLKGEMSMVGPRPERPEFVDALRQAIPHYDLRHMVKPGITGWAQVMHSYAASIQESARKLEYDLYYVRNQSLLLDMKILLRTGWVVLIGRGAR